MKMTTVSIRQGDSLGLEYGIGTESLAGWTCDVAVFAYPVYPTSPATAPVHEATLIGLADDDTRYTGLIDRTETATWPAGRYIVVCDLYNSATGEAREFEATLIVSAQALVTA